jgi:hypothetical protein
LDGNKKGNRKMETGKLITNSDRNVFFILSKGVLYLALLYDAPRDVGLPDDEKGNPAWAELPGSPLGGPIMTRFRTPLSLLVVEGEPIMVTKAVLWGEMEQILCEGRIGSSMKLKRHQESTEDTSKMRFDATEPSTCEYRLARPSVIRTTFSF